MLSFWRAIFYSSLLDPIFTAVASALGVTKQVCKEYCTSGVMEYGLTMLLIVLAVILVIVLIRVFGLLNGGNLSGKYNPESLEKVKSSPLAGKNIVFLGSSVTKGFAAYGKSFVDMIAARTGATCVKEAVSGTTLVDDNAKSYVARLKALDPKTPCDLFVCQLSTNDATKKNPLVKPMIPRPSAARSSTSSTTPRRPGIAPLRSILTQSMLLPSIRTWWRRCMPSPRSGILL